MRKILPCLLITLLLLGGCSKELEPDKAQSVAEHYEALDEITVQAVLRTDYGDRVIDFSVEYTHRKDESGSMTVLSPEDIAGIRADILPGCATLEYDGLALELGPLPGTGLSPMESLPFMIGQWSGGYAVDSGVERMGTRELVCVRYRQTSGGSVLEQTVLFEPGTLLPVRSELYIDGALVVTCTF